MKFQSLIGTVGTALLRLLLYLDRIPFQSLIGTVGTLTALRRGVRVVATAHGEVLLDAVENPVMAPVLGDLDLEARRRRTFQSLIGTVGTLPGSPWPPSTRP